MPHRSLQLSPSMMCADFLNLREELELLAEFGIHWLHIDVMDGHYVPNFTLGTDFCRLLAAHSSSIPLDIHLMVEDVDRHLELFCGVARSPRISFHPETAWHSLATIQRIRKLGASPGIAIDPAVSIESLKHLLPQVDFICVMTVNPGYAGQPLVPGSMEKIAEARAFAERHGLNFDIEVDGNVSWENIPRMVEAGANVLVCGTSSLFQKDTPRRASLEKMRALMSQFAP